MKLDRTQLIAGYPILRIRDMFKRQSTFSRESIEWQMHLTPYKASRLLNQLIKLGYLEFVLPRTAAERVEKTKWYELTPAGRSLALARAVPPMKREKAERLLHEFMGRVREVNESPDFLYKVTKVLVFGSYLRPEAEELNDLDVAVEIETKIKNGDEHVRAEEAFMDQVEAGGRYFSYWLDRLFYPYEMVKTFLRSRSRYLSLHTTDDAILQQTETRQIFPESA